MGIRVGISALLVSASLVAGATGVSTDQRADAPFGQAARLPAVGHGQLDAGAVLSMVRAEGLAVVPPDAQAELAARAARLATALEELGGEVSVAVRDVESGTEIVVGDTVVEAASLMKVDIVATLLRQEAGRPDRHDRALARAMIAVSDNPATDEMLEDVGTESVNEFLSDAGAVTRLEGREWGRTPTSAEDRLRMVRAVLGEDSLLDGRSERLLRRLMTRVADDQRIGVSAAADRPGRTPLKAGYIPDERSDRWYVSSMGEVQAEGRTYQVAVVSSGHRSLEDGTARIERAARLAVAELADLNSGAPAA
ncbi:serine hydrolase [Aeromicrobium sp. CTD01-1L150]|uniref:serine hydrolase n=1 Tax=Aeromicrobium sp. CTD01-1L150 TaxID=3341830 RepID=UPI0035C02A50